MASPAVQRHVVALTVGSSSRGHGGRTRRPCLRSGAGATHRPARGLAPQEAGRDRAGQGAGQAAQDGSRGFEWVASEEWPVSVSSPVPRLHPQNLIPGSFAPQTH